MTIMETVPNPGGKCASCRKNLPKTALVYTRRINRKVSYFCDPRCLKTAAKESRLSA